jgi:hypothetical protein
VNVRLSVASLKSAMTRQPIDASNPPPLVIAGQPVRTRKIVISSV